MGNKIFSSEVGGRLTEVSFDVGRFTGVWYVISHVPNSYETSCDYSPITILPTMGTTDQLRYSIACYRGGAVVAAPTGDLRIPDPNVPSKMQIRPDGVLSFSWANFWIYKTDYTAYAIVGNQLGYLWILSRNPTMSFCRYKDVTVEATRLGFDVDSLRLYFAALTKC